MDQKLFFYKHIKQSFNMYKNFNTKIYAIFLSAHKILNITNEEIPQ